MVEHPITINYVIRTLVPQIFLEFRAAILQSF